MKTANVALSVKRKPTCEIMAINEILASRMTHKELGAIAGDRAGTTIKLLQMEKQWKHCRGEQTACSSWLVCSVFYVRALSGRTSMQEMGNAESGDFSWYGHTRSIGQEPG